ncbi:MAG: AMP-binding protein, partial [Aestuariibacter sp.]|nr:AMP-binding protein [Aestuariibacter sp.]
MPTLLHQFISSQLPRHADKCALVHKNRQFSYSELQDQVVNAANGFVRSGLGPTERVAIYLPKLPETVFSLFGAAMAGGAFVPVNPLLKPQQVAYILRDCNVRILVTSKDRLALLQEVL